MVNNPICTSLEQSQTLVDLGIDIETADMYYVLYNNRSPKLNIKYNSFPNDLFEFTPAWSLSALSDLLPSFIKRNDKDYVLTMLNIGRVVYSNPNEPNLFEADTIINTIDWTLAVIAPKSFNAISIGIAIHI